MKNSIFSFLLILNSVFSFSQDISGQWDGVLKTQGIELRIVFNISKLDHLYKATMDSPDQGVTGIPVTSTIFNDKILTLKVESAKIHYEGTLLNKHKFKGTFYQGGLSFPLVLSKNELENKKAKRPQEPQKPYPYYTEDIVFENKKDQLNLAGTLTLPNKVGEYPCVILITGSGPQNRNEEILEHKPFLVIADYLTKNGIGVLRFDDRGVGDSTGNFSSATTFDFATDVESALAYLKTRKEVKNSEIGLIGHSEGGIVAAIVASRNQDVRFIILLAGATLRGDQLLLLQKKKIETQLNINPIAVEQNQQIFGGACDLIINSNEKDSTIQTKLSQYFTAQYGIALPQDQKANLVKQLTSPWMINFIRLDPALYLEKVKCPILALNGAKDIQVSSKENLKIVKSIIRKSNRAQSKVIEFEGLNHLFQECKTGAVSEYGKIEQTISPLVIEELTTWMKELKE